MRTIGMRDADIAKISATQIQVSEGFGTSGVEIDSIYVSRFQAIRKALDYVAVYGERFPLSHVIKTIMTCNAGHELGHTIDTLTESLLTNRASNNIPFNWPLLGDRSENRSERFAQFWGIVALRSNAEQVQIIQDLWALEAAKVQSVWQAIQSTQSSDAAHLDLFSSFNSVDILLEKLKMEHAREILRARRTLYGGTEPENYASPYSKSEVSSAIQPDL